MLLDHHLRLLARQSAEHHAAGNRRLHLLTNVVGFVALTTALSQVGLGPTDAGTVATGAAVLYMAALDPLAALLVGGATLAWAQVPFAPWGPGNGWIAGVAAPLATFVAFGLCALAGHVYHHEHADFLAGEPKGEKLRGTLHVIAFGAFQFATLVLLDAGWRPGLAARLHAAERALCFRREHLPWTNWGGTAACEAALAFLPETTEDVVAIVKEARAAGRRVRVVGSGFSWPRLCPTDDVLVFAERLDRLALDRSDPARPLLVTGPGATNRQIEAFLGAAGLVLPWNVVLETVRIGGTVNTGTHGSGRATATMGDLLEAVELVDADGTLRVFRASDGGDVFAALRLALGSFGVATRFWLRTEPMVAVRQVDRKVPLGDALASLERLVAEHDAVELYWFPFTDWAWLRVVDRTDAPVTHRPLASRVTQLQHLVQMGFLRATMRVVARRFPAWTPATVRLSAAFLTFGERVVPLPDAQHYRQWIEAMRVGCVEAAFPPGEGFADVKAAWSAIERRIEEAAARGSYPLNLTVNLRFVGRSDALLSPAWGHPVTAWIEALCAERSPGWDAFGAALLGDWLALPDALPHWAKEFEHVAGATALLRSRYGERLDRFVAARAAAGVDPDGTFVNDLVGRLLAEAAGERVAS